jgi:DNA-binding transcriptional LysR family regulator
MDVHLDLHQLRTFHALALGGSFAEAARRLNLTQSAISHAIRKLEASAGTTLVVRQGGRVVLSEEGTALAAACDSIFATLEEVGSRLQRGHEAASGRLRLGAPVEFGCSILMEHIQPFARANPELELDFLLGMDLLDPLLREEIDLAIDCRRHAHPELQRIALFREAYIVVCAPSYLARFPIQAPEELTGCTLLSCDKPGTWWNRFLEVLPEGQRPELRRVASMNQIRAMITAAVHGMGVALVPEYCIRGELERGDLVHVLPGFCPLEDHFHLYQKHAKAGRTKNRLLTEFLRSTPPAAFRPGML